MVVKVADKEQLARLGEGVDIWNAWREQNRYVQVHLPGAKLSKRVLPRANLSGAYLAGAMLSGADLSGADLSGANLSGARLTRVNLSDADLSDADLSGANLFQANLLRAKLMPREIFPGMVKGTDLSRAYLYGAKLIGAELPWAKLSGADLSWAKLSRANLSEADLSGANLFGADLSQATLIKANLSRADLSGANLFRADLSGANVSGRCTATKFVKAKLYGAHLFEAQLFHADLTKANLSEADLSRANLVGSKFTDANLTHCRIYGISAWDLQLDGAERKNLIITQDSEPEITVDNVEVAQFIYLLLHNERIRHVIDTITSKVVLILGRFTPERKVVLNALREELRQHDYLPVLFDFEKPAGKDLTGTVQTLANLARFIIADVTDPSSVPHELAMLVPGTVVPVQPVLLKGQCEYAMFVDLKRRYHWVLKPYRYTSPERLITDLSERVIGPAEAKALKLRGVSQPKGRRPTVGGARRRRNSG